MAVGRCHLSLCRHWHRPEADIGGVHCMRKRGEEDDMWCGWGGECVRETTGECRRFLYGCSISKVGGEQSLSLSVSTSETLSVTSNLSPNRSPVRSRSIPSTRSIPSKDPLLSYQDVLGIPLVLWSSNIIIIRALKYIMWALCAHFYNNNQSILMSSPLQLMIYCRLYKASGNELWYMYRLQLDLLWCWMLMYSGVASGGGQGGWALPFGPGVHRAPQGPPVFSKFYIMVTLILPHFTSNNSGPPPFLSPYATINAHNDANN